MTDIPLIISDDYQIDFCDPTYCIDDIGDDNDLETAVIASIATDRACPDYQYGVNKFDRRGCWQDVYRDDFGSLLWLGMQENQWSNGAKLPQIKAWIKQCLSWLVDDNLVQTDPTIDVEYINDESVSVDITLVATDGKQRKISYTLNI